MMPMWLGRTRRTGDRWAAWLMSITLGSLVVMADTAARHELGSADEQPPGRGRYRDRDLGMAFDFPAHIFQENDDHKHGHYSCDLRSALRLFRLVARSGRDGRRNR
jgi:hypothetical protein